MIRHIWILIAKKLSGEATEEELRELESFSGRTESGSPVEVLEQIWKNTSADLPVAGRDLDQQWAKFQSLVASQKEEPLKQVTDLPARSWKVTMLKYTGYAAAVILLVSIAYLFAIQTRTEQGITAVMAPQNGVSRILLPDGSSVWLNAGSKITYKNNNETKCREVSLSGEAYFDVVKDAHHPFTVTTSAFKITVLGTAFNVRSYDKGKTAEAMLVRGRIELSLMKSPETKYILKPAEKFTVNNAPERTATKHASTVVSETDIDNDLSLIELKKIHEYSVDGMPSEVLWMKNVIDFDNANFEDIAKMMEHKYNVTITFKNDDIKKLKFSGKFRNETLDEALKELQEIIDFKYKTEKDQVTIL